MCRAGYRRLGFLKEPSLKDAKQQVCRDNYRRLGFLKEPSLKDAKQQVCKAGCLGGVNVGPGSVVHSSLKGEELIDQGV